MFTSQGGNRRTQRGGHEKVPGGEGEAWARWWELAGGLTKKTRIDKAEGKQSGGKKNNSNSDQRCKRLKEEKSQRSGEILHSAGIAGGSTVTGKNGNSKGKRGKTSFEKNLPWGTRGEGDIEKKVAPEGVPKKRDPKKKTTSFMRKLSEKKVEERADRLPTSSAGKSKCSGGGRKSSRKGELRAVSSGKRGSSKKGAISQEGKHHWVLIVGNTASSAGREKKPLVRKRPFGV